MCRRKHCSSTIYPIVFRDQKFLWIYDKRPLEWTQRIWCWCSWNQKLWIITKHRRGGRRIFLRSPVELVLFIFILGNSRIMYYLVIKQMYFWPCFWGMVAWNYWHYITKRNGFVTYWVKNAYDEHNGQENGWRYKGEEVMKRIF